MAVRSVAKKITKGRGRTRRNAIKSATGKTDSFSDVKTLSEQSLKKVWDNSSDDIWNEYLK